MKEFRIVEVRNGFVLYEDTGRSSVPTDMTAHQTFEELVKELKERMPYRNSLIILDHTSGNGEVVKDG